MPNDPKSASNRLYRSEVADFAEAMKLIHAQVSDEKKCNETFRREAKLHPGSDPAELERFLADLAENDRHLEQYAGAADLALVIWRQEMAEARNRIIARLRANVDAQLHDMADALENDDYSELAI